MACHVRRGCVFSFRDVLENTLPVPRVCRANGRCVAAAGEQAPAQIVPGDVLAARVAALKG